MVTREKIIETLTELTTEENKLQINMLLEKIASKSDGELKTLLEEKKVNSPKDIRKLAGKIIKKEERSGHKFENLNDIVSFGSTGRTLHIHLIPKDAHHMLTRDGMKEAQIALIDAVEKLKVKMQTEKKYGKAENVYAVSPIMTGIVARWFKQLGFDVKTLPIEVAKEDKELGRFTGKFAGATKLGRANLPKEILMSEEWETAIKSLKEKLGISEKNKTFAQELQTLNSTDTELVQATETIEARSQEPREVKPEVIE